jgi:Ran GTPase-activating protein 1
VDSLKIITKIFQNKGIVALDISNNAVAPTGCQALFDLIKNAPTLQYFWANNCGLAQNGVIHIAKAIEEGTAPLKVLSMTRNRIEVKAVCVGKAVARLADLEELIMFQNGIKEEGMVGLLEGLKHCSKLRKLDLSDNWFLGKSIDLLCEVVEHNQHLVELNIGDCNLSSAEHKKLLAALEKTDRAWEGWGFNYNELSHKKTAKDFLHHLTKKQKLKWLQMKGNDFEEDLIEHFNEHLSKLPHPVRVEFESEEEDGEEAFDHDFKQVIDGLKKLHV